MLTALKALFGIKPPTGITPAMIECLRQNDAEKLATILDAHTAHTATVTEESLSHVSDRGDTTILTIRRKNILALAMDHNADQVIRSLSKLLEKVGLVCVVETYWTQGVLSERQMKKTGFKSKQVTEQGLNEYFKGWARARQKLLFTNHPDERSRRLACENTIRALKETFSKDLNEFI